MANPKHVTLTAATVATVNVDNQYFSNVEVVNVDGVAAVYFTTDGTTPTVGGDGAHVLPAAIGGVDVRAAVTPIVVKLISSGTPKVSVRGL